MSHVRKQIRDNIVTTLTGLSTTGSNVYRSRVYPLAAGKLSGLCIYTKSEEVEYQTINYPRGQYRTLEVIVEGYATGTSNLDNTIDQISLEVEEALATSRTRGGLAKDTLITSVEVNYQADNEKPVAVCTITIEVQYRTMENDVEIAV